MNLLKIDDKEFYLPYRLITNEDIVNFANLTGDRNRIHLDNEFAKNTPFEKCIAHGLFSISVIFGLMYESHLFDELITIFTEIESAKFISPVYPSDKISAKIKIINKYESNKKDGYFVIMDIIGFKEMPDYKEFLKKRAKFKLIKSITQNYEN